MVSFGSFATLWKLHIIATLVLYSSAFTTTNHAASLTHLRIAKRNGAVIPSTLLPTLPMQRRRMANIHHSTNPLTSSDATISNKIKDSFKEKTKIAGLFGLWYALNIGYNIYNKKVLNALPQLTYTVAFLQVFLGLFYIIPVWKLGVRASPKLSNKQMVDLIPVGILHTLTHLGAVVSLSAGAVSFTHIVKAAEPAVSALLSAILFRSFLPIPVYLSLIPVMGGVAIASATELSFTWMSFIAAMISNVASALRAIVGKSSLKKPQGENMNAANTYAVMTIIATILCFPVCILLEGGKIIPTIKTLIQSGLWKKVGIETIISGLFYYLYNEVAFLALDNVAPVTHAIGNTIKRIVIIITSVIVFGTKMSYQGIAGSAIAIGGVFLYSLAKSKFQNSEKK